MGQILSTQPAEEKAEQAQKTIDEVLKSFEDKRKLYLDDLSKARGETADNKNTEVTGGRTISLYSQIFYTEKIGPNSEITDAMNDFFSAADSGIDGNDSEAQHSAIQGAKNLIMAAVDGILGTTSIGAEEIQSFSVIFLNNSFVRVDYRFYQQNIDVVKYLAAVRSTARLVVAEVAVLPIQDMKPAEISYLLSQAFDLQSYKNPIAGLAYLGKIQTSLIQLSVLTAMLQSVLQEEEMEDETGTGQVSTIEDRIKGLLELSKGVSELLQDIQTPLPKPQQLQTSNSRSPVVETDIKDTYNDMAREGKYITSWFIKQMVNFKNASTDLQTGIKKKAFDLLKKTYEDYFNAFSDVYIDEDSWRPQYRAWYTTNKDGFALWWFEFLIKVNEADSQHPFFKDKKGQSTDDPTKWLEILFGSDSGGGQDVANDDNSAIKILNAALEEINKGPRKYNLVEVSVRKMKRQLAQIEYPRSSQIMSSQPGCGVKRV